MVSDKNKEMANKEAQIILARLEVEREEIFQKWKPYYEGKAILDGPCAIEQREATLRAMAEIKEIRQKYGLPEPEDN